jgi:segregation and condensation protein A
MDRDSVYTMEQALESLRSMIGYAGQWAELTQYLPPEWRADPMRRRSATAATFAAALQMVKEGRMELRQDRNFGPLELRSTSADIDGHHGPASAMGTDVSVRSQKDTADE